MNFLGYLRAARDELIGRGEAVTPSEVVDFALAMDGAQVAFDAETGGLAYAKARRDASVILKEIGEANDDPAIAQLFDESAYRPPRCITFRGVGDAEVRHRAIEYATFEDCVGYSRILDENITAAVRARKEWRAWFREQEAAIAQFGTVGEALRHARELKKAA